MKKLANQKDQVENKIVSVPNGFNNIISSNDYAQGHIVSEDLKKINKIESNIEFEIKEKSKVNPKLFLDNYETDYIEFPLPFQDSIMKVWKYLKKI